MKTRALTSLQCFHQVMTQTFVDSCSAGLQTYWLLDGGPLESRERGASPPMAGAKPDTCLSEAPEHSGQCSCPTAGRMWSIFLAGNS